MSDTPSIPASGVPSTQPVPAPAAFPATPPGPAPEPYQPAPLPGGPARRSMAPWIVMAAVFALLIGAAVGYGASQPSKNDLQDQRDAAQAQVTQLEGDLAAQKAETGSATSARDKCSKAAVDASDLIKQDQNLWSDFNDLLDMKPGSAEEIQQEQHMNTQADLMSAQSDVVTGELAACKVAVNG